MLYGVKRVKTKISSLIALLCIVVYVAAVLSAAFQIYANILEQQQTGTRELDKIQNIITQSGEVFFTEPFRENIRKTLEEECKVLQGLIITSDPKTELSFENGWGSAIRWDNGPHFITRLGYVTLPPRQVTVPGYKSVGVFSMIKAVQYEFMADVCKQTLLIILAALLLSFLNMIITMLRSREKSAKGPKAPSPAPGNPPESPAQKAAPQKPAAQKQAAPAPDKNTPDSPSVDDDTDDDFVADNVIENDDMSDFPAFDDFETTPEEDTTNEEIDTDMSEPDMSDMDIDMDMDMDEPDMSNTDTAEPDVSEPEMSDSDTPEKNEDFTLPEFDDTDIPEEQTDSLADDGFHLDDFIDESSLNLPEVAAISDVDDAAVDGITNDDNITFDLQDDIDTLEPVDSEPSDTVSVSPPPNEVGAPNGLYSPRSNVGWEAYTLERLASELHRCAASEQDLIIMLMECAASVNCDERLYKKIADEAIDLFNLKDLTFEYGKRGFTVIIPNESLEEGILKANEFHERIYKTCFDSFQKTNDFIIGISSRSGRLVEAHKLLHEAARALEKARGEPQSPVIAFKSDPEKYREYIRRHF